MPVVGIRRGALQEIVAHACRALPDECCGLLVGGAADRPSGAAVEIVEAVRARNEAAARRRRFELNAEDHIRARRDARRRGLAVVGFYHSHPHSAPEPSEADVAEAAYPDHWYLIVGLAQGTPDVRLYRFDGTGFVAEAWVVVSGGCEADLR
jgi:proteasome lid subunit RPN8/RPN11